MKFIDLLDKYLDARDNFLNFNHAKGIPSMEYQEAAQFIYQTFRNKREELDKALQNVDEILKYLSEDTNGDTGE